MADSTSCSTKFRVAGKEANSFNNFVGCTAKTSLSSRSEVYKRNHCTELLMESPFPSGVQASDNGFVRTVIDCYNEHHNLVIRPDDIWTAILTQFSFYINKNAEEFRGQFVNFEGKKELVVTIDGSLRSAPYDVFVKKMTEKIDENLVDKTVKDWILPNFSTTTAEDIISCGVVFMATTKNYFSFECRLLCGIPYVTLEGTAADWESILNRLEKLKDYKLDQWYDMLKKILDEFIEAKKNKPNIEFWNRICHHVYAGSGSTCISGWLTAFAFFDVDGDRTNSNALDIDKLPSSIVTVDVKIVEGPNEYQTIMFAGHTGFEVLRDGCTLKPHIGWGIALKLTPDEVEKFHEAARRDHMWECEQCEAPLK